MYTAAATPEELPKRMQTPINIPKAHRAMGCASLGQNAAREEMKSRHRRKRKNWVMTAGKRPKKGDKKNDEVGVRKAWMFIKLVANI